VIPVAPGVSPDRAVATALRLASPGGADVHLLHVSPAGQTLDARAHGYLNELRIAFRHGLGLRSRIRMHVAMTDAPDPARGISDFSRSVDADAIVLPTRGPNRPLNAERDITGDLFLHAPCPVLTAPPRAQIGTRALHRLLVPSRPTPEQSYASQLAAAWTGLHPEQLTPTLGRPLFFEPDDLFVAPPGQEALALVRSQPCTLWIPPIATSARALQPVA
jgi:nucleotide-binding universal stress UspA family protein